MLVFITYIQMHLHINVAASDKPRHLAFEPGGQKATINMAPSPIALWEVDEIRGFQRPLVPVCVAGVAKQARR